MAWVVDYKDQHGKRRHKTFRTKKAADSWATDTLFQVKAGTHTPDSASVTIKEAGERWIDQARHDGLERSSVTQYRQHLDLHICPFIGAKKLSRLTIPVVKDFQRVLSREGRSPQMVKKITSSLGSLISEAQEYGLVSRNVVREMQQRKRHQRGQAKRHKRKLEIGKDIPNKDEIRAMFNTAKGRWRPFVITALFTGMRASELRGLTWANVDLEGGTLTVRQRADKWNAIGPPKSVAGEREIPLAPIVVNTLKDWKLSCPRQNRAKDQPGELHFVFPNGLGRVESHSNVHSRGFVPLQIAAGVTVETGEKDQDGKSVFKAKYGLHALRHAAASLFIEQGMKPKRVQEIMGHSTISMTLDTYTHLYPAPEDDQAAMAQVQARLLG
jgi:integrase